MSTEYLSFGDCQLLVKNNKYLKLYKHLIFIAKNRTLSNKEYTEKHHIIPKCVGGTDHSENLIILTFREHFIAHWLLSEISNDSKIRHAIRAMSIHKVGRTFSAWQYALFKSIKYVPLIETRQKISVSQKKCWTDERRKKMSEFQKSKWTIEKRKEMSEMMQGENNHFYGKNHSEKTRKKMSESQQGISTPHSEETKQKISFTQQGKKNSFYGRKHSKESLEKMSIALSGKNNPMYGKNHSEKARKKIAAKASVKIMINDVIYPSIKEAAERNNTSENTIRNWVKKGIASRLSK